MVLSYREREPTSNLVFAFGGRSECENHNEWSATPSIRAGVNVSAFTFAITGEAQAANANETQMGSKLK